MGLPVAPRSCCPIAGRLVVAEVNACLVLTGAQADRSRAGSPQILAVRRCRSGHAIGPLDQAGERMAAIWVSNGGGVHRIAVHIGPGEGYGYARDSCAARDVIQLAGDAAYRLLVAEVN